MALPTTALICAEHEGVIVFLRELLTIESEDLPEVLLECRLISELDVFSLSFTCNTEFIYLSLLPAAPDFIRFVQSNIPPYSQVISQRFL